MSVCLPSLAFFHQPEFSPSTAFHHQPLRHFPVSHLRSGSDRFPQAGLTAGVAPKITRHSYVLQQARCRVTVHRMGLYGVRRPKTAATPLLACLLACLLPSLPAWLTTCPATSPARGLVPRTIRGLVSAAKTTLGPSVLQFHTSRHPLGPEAQVVQAGLY